MNNDKIKKQINGHLQFIESFERQMMGFRQVCVKNNKLLTISTMQGMVDSDLENRCKKIRNLIQKEASWRDCRKGNPDKDGTYIIYTADESTAMCHFSNETWQGWRNVLAWMPMPDKPDFI